MSVVLYPCILCVAVLMDLFVNCLVKQFAICFECGFKYLLNVMEVFGVCEGALLDKPYMVFKGMCVLCL